MPESADLLVEIGTEELPPKALDQLSVAFLDGLDRQLRQAHLGYGKLHRYATPRRLAVLVSDLALTQPEREVERRGPAVRAAFDGAGNPTKAAEGFARSCGIALAELAREETEKGSWLVFRRNTPGKPAEELLPQLIEQALAELPIAKRMRWSDRNEEFVRPVHWIVVLLGNQVVPCQILGVTAGRNTRGHRFHAPDPVAIQTPAAYLETLAGLKVLGDVDERREKIRSGVERLARDTGGVAVIESSLLDEVTALVEWPVPIAGEFDAGFLDVPKEALIKTMQEHQKYFPIIDIASGALLPCFIAVANLDSKDPAQIRAGNERVIRPRFSDAAFFWQQDLKQPLAARREALGAVVFQERLGSLLQKSERVAGISAAIAPQLSLDPEQAVRAAQLSKCDLLTHMVTEFPALQGIMGRHYAQRSGETETVAAALEEQYLPRHAGDRLPQTDCGRVIAVADRLDTLVGIFAIGGKPTGEKDPFGLRRAAIGVLRILIETPLNLDLLALLNVTAELHQGTASAATVADVFAYMMERLKGYYAEQGIAPDTIDAVLARRPSRPCDCDLRVRAVQQFRELVAAESLAAANKRIRNILRKAEIRIPTTVDRALLTDAAEIGLAERIREQSDLVEPLFGQGRYAEALNQLASLREPVDRFFDEVMVMAEDASLRENRLALLASLESLFLRAADFSRLQ